MSTLKKLQTLDEDEYKEFVRVLDKEVKREVKKINKQDFITDFLCPVCGQSVAMYFKNCTPAEKPQYCHSCGQRLSFERADKRCFR